jgi:hypothetical protein
MDTSEREKLAAGLVGKTLDEAKDMCDKQDTRLRVVSVDGVGQIVTCDLRFDRINVYLFNGVVTKSRIG